MILIAMLEHFYIIFMADIACFLMKWLKLFKAYEKSLRMALSHRRWVFPDYVLGKETLIYQGNSVHETLIATINSSSWPVYSYFTWPQWYCCTMIIFFKILIMKSLSWWLLKVCARWKFSARNLSPNLYLVNNINRLKYLSPISMWPFHFCPEQNLLNDNDSLPRGEFYRLKYRLF